MSAFTFSPALGWPVAIVVSIAVIGLAVAGLVRMARDRSGSDATALDWVRRLLAAVTVAVLACGPATVRPTGSQAVNATDVFVAVDVTGSMAVRDARYGSDDAVTRLEAAAKAVDDIVSLHPGASFAAISFGTTGTLDLPLTPDTRAVANWAKGLRPEATGVSTGSNLDAAIDPALLAMRKAREAHPNDMIVFYYLSDGEQTSSKARRTFTSLRQYADAGAVVGLGSAQGGEIPKVSADGTVEDGTVTDPTTGQPGVSRMDEKTLRAIADEIGGECVLAAADVTAASSLQGKASGEWRVAATAGQRTRVIPFVWPFLAILAALMVWEVGRQFFLYRRHL